MVNNVRKLLIEKELLFLIPTIFWIFLMTIVNYFFSSNIINSDMSSEMVLAREMANNNTLFTSDWFFSTEIRLIYTQLVSVFLFEIMDSWVLIRTITNLVFFIVMLLSYFYCVKPLGISKKAKYLSSMLLFIPYSVEFLDIVHVGNSYITHFIFVFLGVGLALRLFKKIEVKNLIFFIIVNFISGMMGIRYLVILALPILIASCFFVYFQHQEEKKTIFSIQTLKNQKLILSLVGMVASFAGYKINSEVLIEIFNFAFSDCDNLIFVDFTFTNVFVNLFYELSTFLTDSFSLFGWLNGMLIQSTWGVGNICALLIVIIQIIIVIRALKNYKEFSDSEKQILLFMISGLFLNTFLFAFVKGLYGARYYMFVFILIIPIIAVMYSKDKFIKEDFSKLLLIFLFISVSFNGIKTVYYAASHDENKGIKKASEFLAENDLTFGHATFWNANIITELTDGKVDVVNIMSEGLVSPYHWLTTKRYYRESEWKKREEDKVFLLLSHEEVSSNENEAILKAGELVYMDEYYIFTYDKKYIMDTHGQKLFVD